MGSSRRTRDSEILPRLNAAGIWADAISRNLSKGYPGGRGDRGNLLLWCSCFDLDKVSTGMTSVKAPQTGGIP